jgi:hypothetical protein
VTDEGRKNRIRQALAAHEQLPPAQRETLSLHWRGEARLFPVIQLEVDVPLLNHNSHRLQAMLEDHPQRQVVEGDPRGDKAQKVIAQVLEKRHRNFLRLKESLEAEGQRDAGVVTREGVLINANTRAVGLRALADGGKRWIRAAVLPPDASDQELAELELELQVQDPLKDDYRLTEELLFIEEMYREYGKSEKQIAFDLRWATKDGRSARHGESEVQQRRRILSLIREMQKLTDPPLPLTFFDDKLEQLRALEKDYYKLREEDPAAARKFRTNWLAAALAGASSVHDLRQVDEEFVTYLRPRLEEDSKLGEKAEELLEAKESKGNGANPPGVDALGDDEEEKEADPKGAEGDEGDVKQILNLLAADLVEQKPTVTLPGGEEQVDRDVFKNSVKQAVKNAVKDRRSIEKAADQLEEPIAQVREAARLLGKAENAYRAVRTTEKFDQKHRGQFSYQLKKARKQLDKLEKLEAE